MIGKERYLVLRILDRVLSNKLQFYELKQFIGVLYTIKNPTQICQCFLVTHRAEGCKSITLAGMITFIFEKGVNELRGIWYQ